MLPRPRLRVHRSNRSNAGSLNLAIEAPPSLDIARFGSLKLCSVGQNRHAHHSSLMKLGEWSACFPRTDNEDNSIRAASSRLQCVHHGTVKMEPGGPVCNRWLSGIVARLRETIGELEFSVEVGPAVGSIGDERRKHRVVKELGDWY